MRPNPFMGRADAVQIERHDGHFASYCPKSDAPASRVVVCALLSASLSGRGMAESAEDSPERFRRYSDKCASGASTFLLRPLCESSGCVISTQTNVYLRLERAMNRAFASDFDQLRVLFLGQRTGQLHLHIDPIEQALLGFAFFTIFRVNARMRERDNNVLQWNLLPA